MPYKRRKTTAAIEGSPLQQLSRSKVFGSCMSIGSWIASPRDFKFNTNALHQCYARYTSPPDRKLAGSSVSFDVSFNATLLRGNFLYMLDRADWGDLGPVQTKMALHGGQAKMHSGGSCVRLFPGLSGADGKVRAKRPDYLISSNG